MLPLITHPAYDIPLPDGHRFPATKFSALMQHMETSGLLQSFEIFHPEPASRQDLKITQHPDYIDAIAEGTLDPAALRILGLNWSQVLANRSFLAVNGTLLTACKALEQGLACHAAGGTHHAHFAHGAGYCVFNDLAYTATRLINEGRVGSVLILDCDVHQGDGTARILEGNASVFTCSVHCRENYPARKASSDLDVEVPKGTGDEGYIAYLEDALEQIDRQMPQIDLVLYDAGIDVHEDDRLGLLNLTYDGISRRDTHVIRHFRERSIPVATVIGGGYGQDINEVAARHSTVFQSAANLVKLS